MYLYIKASSSSHHPQVSNAQYHKVSYPVSSIIMFGPETRGLPEEIREHSNASSIKIPMAKHQRSINLSNAVAICLFEILRQQEFNF